MTESATSPLGADEYIQQIGSRGQRNPLARQSRRRRVKAVNLMRLSIVVFVLALWEFAASTKSIDPFLWGQPSQVWATLASWITVGTPHGSLGTQILVTLEETVFGFAIGVALGVVCGIALGGSSFLADLFSPFIKVANSIPRIILGSIFTVAFGFGLQSKIVLAFVLVFFGVFFNAFQGTREVDGNLIANARILGASRAQIIRQVIVPSAFTWILASLHVSFGFALIGALVGEILGADQGLGLLIRSSQNNFDMNGVLAGMVVVAVIALIAETLITVLERRILRWRQPSGSAVIPGIDLESPSRSPTSKRRHLLAPKWLAIVIVTALTLIFCINTITSSGSRGLKSAADLTIMIGGISKQIYLPYMLAQQLGLYKKAGVKVNLVDEPAGGDATTNLLSGQVQGVGGFYDHTIVLQGMGKATESVVSMLQSPGEVELCRTDLQGQIHSAAYWKGRSLGITDTGSSTDFLTQYITTKAGVDPASTTRRGVGAGQTFLAALHQKAIDCGMTTEPTASQALASGEAYILVDTRTVAGTQNTFGGLYPATSLYMTTAYVNSHKDIIQKLVNAYVATLAWIQTHSGSQIADEMPASYYVGVGKTPTPKHSTAKRVSSTPPERCRRADRASAWRFCRPSTPR